MKEILTQEDVYSLFNSITLDKEIDYMRSIIKSKQMKEHEKNK